MNLGTQLACQMPHCGQVVTVTEPGELGPCPKCGSRYWRTVDPHANEPTQDYLLSGWDRRLLRILGIAAGLLSAFLHAFG